MILAMICFFIGIGLVIYSLLYSLMNIGFVLVGALVGYWVFKQGRRNYYW